MLDGPSLVRVLKACGVTHVVWIPDSELGKWDAALQAEPDLHLIRVCREGEAIAVAAGLYIRRQASGWLSSSVPACLKPAIRCGTSFTISNCRSFSSSACRLSRFFERADCRHLPSLFSVPILNAWRLPFVFLDPATSSTSRRRITTKPAPPTLPLPPCCPNEVSTMTQREVLEVLAADRGNHVVITTMTPVGISPRCPTLRSISPIYPLQWEWHPPLGLAWR